MLKDELDKHLNIVVDRNQKAPLSMIMKSNDATVSNANQHRKARRDHTVLQDGIVVLTGLLQTYVLPQTVDYRLIKTFDESSFLYIFGEHPPILQLDIVFSDGTLYITESSNSAFNAFPDSTNKKDKFYKKLDIFELIKNKTFLITEKTKADRLIGFTFNRALIRGYVVSIVSAGSVNQPGIINATLQVVVKDVDTLPVREIIEVNKVPDKVSTPTTFFSTPVPTPG